MHIIDEDWIKSVRMADDFHLGMSKYAEHFRFVPVASILVSLFSSCCQGKILGVGISLLGQFVILSPLRAVVIDRRLDHVQFKSKGLDCPS